MGNMQYKIFFELIFHWLMEVASNKNIGSSIQPFKI